MSVHKPDCLALSRRHFLQASLSLATLPLFAQTSTRAPVVLSAAWAADDAWRAGAIDQAGIALPGRGHVLVPDPRRYGEAIVVARRPGYYLARVDWQRGKLLQQGPLEADRNLVGHAVFSADGTQLITAETDERTGQGRLALRDAVTFKRLDDRPSYGIGPHELVWLDTDTLAVANGGILTLPETGRYKRNLGQMDPSLAIINWRDGGLIKTHQLANRQLSIRHLAVTTDGTLAAALQNEGTQPSSLLALLREGAFQLVDTPPSLTQQMAGYAASLAARGNRLLMPCPRGNLLTEWNSEGQLIGQQALPKVFGATALGERWLASGEGGELWQLAPDGLAIQQSRQIAGMHWDNHLTVVV